MPSRRSGPGQGSCFCISDFRKELPTLEETWPKAEDQNILMIFSWRDFLSVSTTDCLLATEDSVSPKEQLFVAPFWMLPVVAQCAVQFSALLKGFYFWKCFTLVFTKCQPKLCSSSIVKKPYLFLYFWPKFIVWPKAGFSLFPACLDHDVTDWRFWFLILNWCCCQGSKEAVQQITTVGQLLWQWIMQKQGWFLTV